MLRCTATSDKLLKSILRISPEVSNALSLQRPVVALESTIISHGMPYPQNLGVAQDVESILRSKGVVPATIAIRDGVCRVGLSQDELHDLSLSGMEGRAMKCSTRDMPLLLARSRVASNSINSAAKSQWGATTVASTMRLAKLAGITTFVTGGTGGVHRGATETMDISADLFELSQCPIVVISAGIKSILDIPKTLEQLESLGVPVVSYKTLDFPAFFSSTSGTPSPWRVDSSKEIAESYLCARALGLSSGMLVANPNTDPAGSLVEEAIGEALDDAAKYNITGRDVTPHVLKLVNEKTKGDSLRSNIALVKNNASLGADVANSIASLAPQYYDGFSEKKERAFFVSPGHVIANNSASLSSAKLDSSSPSFTLPYPSVVVMGGAVVDLIARPKPETQLIPFTSNPGECNESDGGVGRNIAETLGRLGAKPLFYTVVGDDDRGEALRNRLGNECGVLDVKETVNVSRDDRTASYFAVLDGDGDLQTAIADMSINSKIPLPSFEVLQHAKILILDANPKFESLLTAATVARDMGVEVMLEPTSIPKISHLAIKDYISKDTNGILLSCLTYATPNVGELLAWADALITKDDDCAASAINSTDEETKIRNAAKAVLHRMRPNTEAHLIITMGANGVLLASREKMNADTTFNESAITFAHFPSSRNMDRELGVNYTGAGDTLVGAFVDAHFINGHSLKNAIKIGMDAAVVSIEFPDGAISPVLGRV